MRLDRFLSQATGQSRSQVRTLIRRGRASIDGVKVRSAASQVVEDQQVTLNGRALALPQGLYLMLHKPCGLISATQDGQQETVMSLLPPAIAARVHLVGRLDRETSGLLLVTDDGDWSHRITSPRHQCSKTYLATLAEPLIDEAGIRLSQGMLLRNETAPTRPARLERLSDRQVRITVTEGRYHLVRRLFAALGNRVVTLHRERVGELLLDSALSPGAWRELSESERRAADGTDGAAHEAPDID